jgi:hypothetical protein
MSYDLMLLADIGPARTEVCRLLENSPDIRPDPKIENRYWLNTPRGGAQLNIGTKDPVESIHVEVESMDVPELEAATRRALALADQLDMRVSDVQWGHDDHPEDLPELVRYWTGLSSSTASPESASRRPWWKVWG